MESGERRRIGTRLRPAPTLIGVLLVVELLISIPLAVDLHRLSTPLGTARAYLQATRDGDCDRLVDLRVASVRRAGTALAKTQLLWCRGQGNQLQGPERGPVQRGTSTVVVERGLTLTLVRRSGQWRVLAVGPCPVLPQRWRDVEPACNLPTS